jgi:general secretion pathway protein G
MTMRREGFTLIELLVVLAIVAVLLTIVVPRYADRIDVAKETVLRDNLRGVRDVIDKFYGDQGRFPESLEELVEKQYLKTLPVDPLTDSELTWQIVEAPSGFKGRVYDIRSGASGNGRNGRPYAEW